LRWAGDVCPRRANSGLTAAKTRRKVGVLALPEGPVGAAIGFWGDGCGVMGLCVSYPPLPLDKNGERAALSQP
jgi:hypothetical protein